MNPIEQIRQSLGIKDSAAEVVMVVAVFGGMVEAHGREGKVLNLAGNWSIGSRLIIKNGVVQSVVIESGLIVYEN